MQISAEIIDHLFLIDFVLINWKSEIQFCAQKLAAHGKISFVLLAWRKCSRNHKNHFHKNALGLQLHLVMK